MEERTTIILGRPILPQDLLKILPSMWMLKWDHAGHYNIIQMKDYGSKSFKNEYYIIPDAPMDQWSERVLAFIIKLLEK